MYIINDAFVLASFLTALQGRHERSSKEQLPRLLGWGLLVLTSLLFCAIGLVQWFLWSQPEAWQLVFIMLAVGAVGLGFFLHTQQTIEFTATAIVQRSPLPFERWSVPYETITAIGLEQHRQAITTLAIATSSRSSRTIPCFSSMQPICTRYIERAQAV
jgi:hypothetical protein